MQLSATFALDGLLGVSIGSENEENGAGLSPRRLTSMRNLLA
jgi:hypothetical protein